MATKKIKVEIYLGSKNQPISRDCRPAYVTMYPWAMFSKAGAGTLRKFLQHCNNCAGILTKKLFCIPLINK